VTVQQTQVLLVDDSEASRYLTGSWLRRNGYAVTEATTGGEALSAMEQARFDAVLLDVHLPDMSGFEVCERIKGDPRTAGLPVIHISATAIEVADKEQGLNRGADAYLVEPLDPRELMATLEAALRYSRARAEAEHLAKKLTQLTELMLAVNSASTFDDVLSTAATGAAVIFGGEVTVLTMTPTEALRAATATPHTAVATLRTEPLDTTPPGAKPDTNVEMDETSTNVVVRPKPSRIAVRVTVPAGAVTTEQDRNVLLQFAQIAALACENLRSLSGEHTLALTLQHSLLPRALPDNPSVQMAARYVPASRNAEIGGDFYEVAELDGHVLVAIGDVTGHSLAAATVMGEVRHALRAYAVEGHGPVQILDRLDAMVRRFHPQWLTTLCLMDIDPVTGVTEVANAGHIPPLVATETSTSYLDAYGPLLGIGLPRPEATRLTLPKGALTLMVTDGLIETRTRNIDDGMDALLAAVNPDDELEPLCERILDQFGHNAEDDIALLALRLT
jgi:serine phosphatase RsbU (regulator of sigma subunit)/CheY-like chemotaxis protein